MITAIKILSVLILMSFAVENLSKASDFNVIIGLLETLLSGLIVYTLIKPLKEKL